MENLLPFWNYQLFQIGGVEYTVGQFILLALLLIFGFGISKLLENLFKKRLAKTQLRPQAIQTLQSIIDYYENTDDGILDQARRKKAEIQKMQDAKQGEAVEEEIEIEMGEGTSGDEQQNN